MHAALTAVLGDPAPIKLATALIEHGEWQHALIVLKHSEFNLLTHRAVCCALLQKLQDLLQRIPQCGVGPPEATARLPGAAPTGKKARAADTAASATAPAEFTPLMLQMIGVCFQSCLGFSFQVEVSLWPYRSNTKYRTAANIVPDLLHSEQWRPPEPTCMCKWCTVWSSYYMPECRMLLIAPMQAMHTWSAGAGTSLLPET